MTYRVGRHWGVTIVREGNSGVLDRVTGRDANDQLVAVVTNGDSALAERICELLNGAVLVTPLADSCTCPPAYGSSTKPDPNCVVHQGRRARGPKPPPLGIGCICDGSGRTCPRHGAVS